MRPCAHIRACTIYKKLSHENLMLDEGEEPFAKKFGILTVQRKIVLSRYERDSDVPTFGER